ncbi:hypothetical protein Mgra_00006546, partial [Meloidogyne graminicola]
MNFSFVEMNFLIQILMPMQFHIITSQNFELNTYIQNIGDQYLNSLKTESSLTQTLKHETYNKLNKIINYYNNLLPTTIINQGNISLNDFQIKTVRKVLKMPQGRRFELIINIFKHWNIIN